MKLNKTSSALALALGVASVAQAQQQIYIGGATSFRADIFQALADEGLTPNAGANTSDNTFTFTGTISNSKIGTITNGSAGQSVDVYVGLTGTAEAFNDLINKVSPIYTNTSGSAFTYVNGADLAFSDVEQATTVFAGSIKELSSIDGLASSYGAGIAVEPYVWAASADAAAKVKNVTAFLLNDIFPLGTQPLSYFDGNPADAGTPVYLAARTNDAGTRFIAELTDGLPTASFDPRQPIVEYTINGTLGTPPATGTWQNVGNNGYSSSGNVVKALNVVGAGAAIGYISFSDAGGLLNGATPINFQGVSPYIGSSFTPNSTPFNIAGVENGSYTFWSYDHLFESEDVADSSFIATKFGPDLINAIEYEVVHPPVGTVQATDLIKNLNVNRSNDGGDINQGN
jgi:hypothetical protein